MLSAADRAIGFHPKRNGEADWRAAANPLFHLVTFFPLELPLPQVGRN